MKNRELKFKEFCSHFKCEFACSLIAVAKPKLHLLERLQQAAAAYLTKCLPDQTVVNRKLLADGTQLLKEYEKQSNNIKNMTPNGMVVPKRHLILEYNLFASAFNDLIDDIGIVSQIDSWVNPPNLRFKAGIIDPKLLERDYASERTHSEAWLPINTSRCYSIFIPLLGDIEKNRVEFFAPPEDFTEDWLKPQTSYKEGAEIAKKYRPLDLIYRTGEVYLADSATLHASKRDANAGPRASIDLNFIPKHSAKSGDHENFVPQSEISKTGKTKLLVFTDTLEEYVDTQGATKHPTENRKIVDLI